MRRLKAIDLFSGTGGLTEGLKQAGFDVVGAVEISSVAASSYQLNHDAKVWCTDIRDISGIELMDELGLQPGELDLLAGCPPCQGFSTLRTRRRSLAIGDHRNNLLFEFLRLATVLQPKAIMMENVPNLGRDSRMATFLEGLQALGYYGESDAVRICDAADYGVPQRRRRMILLTGKGTRPNFASTVAKRRSVRDAIGALPQPGRGTDPLHDYSIPRRDIVMQRIEAIPKDGGSRGSLPPDLQLSCHRRSNGFTDVYGRMSWDSVAPTITSGCTNPSKGRFLHPEQNRAITLREAALLQSFAEDYKFDASKGRQVVAEMIGNALPPEFIRVHALEIKEYLYESS